MKRFLEMGVALGLVATLTIFALARIALEVIGATTAPEDFSLLMGRVLAMLSWLFSTPWWVATAILVLLVGAAAYLFYRGISGVVRETEVRINEDQIKAFERIAESIADRQLGIATEINQRQSELAREILGPVARLTALIGQADRIRDRQKRLISAQAARDLGERHYDELRAILPTEQQRIDRLSQELSSILVIEPDFRVGQGDRMAAELSKAQDKPNLGDQRAAYCSFIVARDMLSFDIEHTLKMMDFEINKLVKNIGWIN